MAKSEDLAKRIENIIVDGNKEVIKRLDNLEGGQKEVIRRLDNLEGDAETLKSGQSKLEKKVDSVHTSIKSEIKVTGYVLDSKIDESKQELKADIKRVENKQDEHIKLPTHV